MRGEPVWKAHRTHVYQRLVQSGWSHRTTGLWEYAFMLAGAVSAVLALQMPPFMQGLMIIGWMVLYVALIVWAARRTAA